MTSHVSISDEAIDSDTQLVRAQGELDLYAAPEFKRLLAETIESGKVRIVVDLTDAAFMDSTALGVLVEARSRMEDRQAFLLAAPGAETRRALEVSGLDRHFNVRESVDEALAS